MVDGFFLVEYFHSLPAWSLSLVLPNGVIFVYMAVRISILILLLIWFSVLASLLFICHCRDVNRKMANLVRWLSTARIPPTWQQQIAIRHSLGFILAEHLKISVTILKGSHELFSWILLIALAANIPGNVYLLFKLQAGIWVSRSDFVLGLVWFCFQILLMVVSIGPLGKLQKVVHQMRRPIPKLMFLLNGSDLLGAKWKCLLLFERLTYGPKFGLSIGSLNVITNRVLFEVGNGILRILLN